MQLAGMTLVKTAVDSDAGQIYNAVVEAHHQSVLKLCDGLNTGFLQEIQCSGQTHDAVVVLGAGLQTGGVTNRCIRSLLGKRR